MAISDEEKKAAAERREQQAASVLEDINLMDDTISGKIPESQLLSAPQAPETIEEPAEKESFEAEPIVAEPEPEVEVIPEPTAMQPVAVTPPIEDEYDFSFINELARQALTGAPTTQVASTPVTPTTPPVQITPTVATTPTDLISVEEMSAAFESPQKMVELLGKVYQRALSDAVQRSLMELPNAVRPVIKQESDLAELAANFYKGNPELNNYRDFVQYCAVQVESKHPDWTPKQVMDETAKVAKARIPMLREAMQRQKRAPTKPSFVGDQAQRGKNKPAAAKLSALEADIASMPNSF